MRRMRTASKPSAANNSRAALIARARNSASRSMLRRGRPRTAVLEDFRFDVARFIAIFFSTRTTNRSEPSGGTQMIRHGVAAKRLAALAMAGTLGACGVSSEPVGTAASCPVPGTPLISAHRGGAAYAPENTMTAFANEIGRAHV